MVNALTCSASSNDLSLSQFLTRVMKIITIMAKRSQIITILAKNNANYHNSGYNHIIFAAIDKRSRHNYHKIGRGDKIVAAVSSPILQYACCDIAIGWVKTPD